MADVTMRGLEASSRELAIKNVTKVNEVKEKEHKAPITLEAENRAKDFSGDAAVLTILNSTRRKVDYMERSMIAEQTERLDRNSLLNTVTQLSVRANDASVSAERRRDIREEIHNIMSDMNKMSNIKTSSDPNEGQEIVARARVNMLEDARETMNAQANQVNANVLGLLV